MDWCVCVVLCRHRNPQYFFVEWIIVGCLSTLMVMKGVECRSVVWCMMCDAVDDVIPFQIIEAILFFIFGIMIRRAVHNTAMSLTVGNDFPVPLSLIFLFLSNPLPLPLVFPLSLALSSSSFLFLSLFHSFPSPLP